MTVRRFLRFLLGALLATVLVVAVATASAVYFLYAPPPEPPLLSGSLAKGSIAVGGLTRTYRSYLPQGLRKGAPLVLVLHGAGESSAEIRVETGYAFERLADRQGLAIVYPDGFEGWWNSCVAIDDSAANRQNIDDVGFLEALRDKFIGEFGSDPDHVFAVGLSNGGDMAIRLALEAPASYRAVAPVAANLPAPENFKCKPAAPSGTSVLLIHGSKDPLVPFRGGEGSLFGFYRSGQVLSSRQTGQYFAKRAGIGSGPAVTAGKTADGFPFERSLWGGGSATEVELFAIEGAGHVFPQPYSRAPRLLGASPADPDAAVLIWEFFARQDRPLPVLR
jgi:polyhydroxybutyrate depolymerase